MVASQSNTKEQYFALNEIYLILACVISRPRYFTINGICAVPFNSLSMCCSPAATPYNYNKQASKLRALKIKNSFSIQL